jgi:aspartate/methionine/tyrosine aminotransferase
LWDRNHDTAFLLQRDGIAANPENIFLTSGASNGISLVLQALIADEKCGVMVPSPQYPFYSASITLLGGQIVGYYLDESKGWDLNLETLEKTYRKALEDGVQVRGLVLINPGNPTGQVLSKSPIQDICTFCAEHNIVLLADEVYQQNIYQDGAHFTSCKLAAKEAGLLQNDSIELVSFHSTSKGLFGECGRRGGYMELVGIDSQVEDQIYKLASASLCSSLSGQIMTSLMVKGPEPGDESYESHEKEKNLIYQSLKRRANLVSQGLNSIPGFSCQSAQGAMYCFPSIQLPNGVIQAAKLQNVSPDTIYALDLLECTGICVVPASGFKQKEGRFGFRTTFLASEKDMENAILAMKRHYVEFCQKYQ